MAVTAAVRYTMAPSTGGGDAREDLPQSRSPNSSFLSTGTSKSYNARDTSASPRDTLEELRQSHTSILNITTDGEESETDDDAASTVAEEEDLAMFAHLYQPPTRLVEDGESEDGSEGIETPLEFHSVAPEDTPKPSAALNRVCPSSRDSPTSTTCCPSPERSNHKSLLGDLSTSFDIGMESFTDTLCGVGEDAAMPCGGLLTTRESSLLLRHQMEMDLMQLLGCCDDPTDEELAAWTSPSLCPVFFTKKSKMTIRNTKDSNNNNGDAVQARVQRIHRISAISRKKKQRGVELKRTKSIDNSMLMVVSTDVSTETYFQDALSSAGTFLGLEEDLQQPILDLNDDDGYDSDPGDFLFDASSTTGEKVVFHDPLNVSAITQELEDEQTDCEIYEAVQESLNYTWNLTWHPSKENLLTTTGGQQTNPQPVQIWFERGNVLNYGHTIIEPQLMFRSDGLARPHSLRLLNVCRLLTMDEVDRTKFPLARSNHSIIVRMVKGEDYLFEASSVVERNYILQRWKLVVARMATLAVFEDIPAMTHEFFAYIPPPPF